MTLNSSDEIRERIVEVTRSYLGTPWRHRGRTHSGIDCAGLPIVVGRELGLHDYDDSAKYGKMTTGVNVVRYFDAHCDRISDLSKLLPGDIVIFKDQVFAQHVGIMSSKENVIHATVYKRKVVEEPLVGEFKSKLLRGYRFRCFNGR